MPEIDLSDFETRIVTRQLRKEDHAAVVALQRRCFENMPERMAVWTKEEFESQIDHFPEGQIAVEFEGEIVASSSSLIIDYDLYSDWHDWLTVADNGYIRNHDPDGDFLYGIEIMVSPEYRGMKLARRIYEARKQIVRERNLKGIVIGGRMPGYAKYQHEMTAHEYAEAAEQKSIYDPVLTTQLANGFELKQLIRDYIPTDEDSAGWATHMEWLNLDYRPYKKRALQAVEIVRVAVVQYQMRRVGSFEEFAQQCRFFVDTASDYKCDFLVFPELFTTQLLSLVPGARRPAEAARRLAEFTPQYLELFTELAVTHHVNIIGGSAFNVEEGSLFNIAYLFRRDGTLGKQYKVHVTPAEWKWWGVVGGDRVEVFETDCGRIAIQICYAVEFPELSRVASRKGAQLLFVPFNTDERMGYLRVRNCAMARCIENHMYVVISGCVGNLPDVRNADIHYAQSGIFTPADIPFHRDAIAAECTPNVETIVMQDLDVELLRRHRYRGTTTNWRDRRRDLYRVTFKDGDRDLSI